MGDELRGENLVHLNVRFSTETELKKIQDFLYEKSGQGVSFTGLVEAMANEVTIVTAVHNIKASAVILSPIASKEAPRYRGEEEVCKDTNIKPLSPRESPQLRKRSV